MARARNRRSALRGSLVATAAVGLVAAMASAPNAAGAPASAKPAPGASVTKFSGPVKPGSSKPKGLAAKGNIGFLLRLSAKSTSSVYSTTTRARGTASARSAARAQLATVRSAQNRVIAALPSRSKVLYRTHAALAGVAVFTDARNFAALRRITGVTAVYPIAAKKPSLTYAVPYQGGAAAWQAYGDLGQDSTIAIIDTGSDYTHADLGGPGTVAAYQAALANDTEVPDANLYDPNKFDFATTGVDGNPAYMYDFAGDAYDADSADPNAATPHPDPNPLDCAGHGSHVAGIAAGYGEWGNGDTYDGPYTKKTPFDELRIGPGVAPKARIFSYKVFGCEGSTNVAGEAIDKAMDPNGDGDTSDHADVVNMSLGSDFTYPDDGDAQLVNEASAIAGVTMVVSSGNAGDLYDTGGSPGDAVRALTVASSQDASSTVDALHVTIAGTAHDYAAERSDAYDWSTKPDLSGQVVRLTQPGNLDGCDDITTPYKDAIAGKVAFVEWDDNDTTRRCGSVARSGKLAAAGASGFIFGSSDENFTAGITGSAVIPGVLVAKSGADAIRTALIASQPVAATGTTYGGFDQFDPGLNDTLSSFSSRGIHDAGNVKPDVTAIGASVWSTGMGTGNEGLNDSGTSMASPMVAGTAALVKSKHPDWTPEQVKADIMNTADADVYRDANFSGPKYAPNRVGTGRLDIKKALDNTILAYTVDGPNGTSTGAVSASWGALQVPANSGEWTGSKTIKLQNTGLDAVTYDVSFKDRTTIPGVSYSVVPSTVTVAPRQSAAVTLTLTIEPDQLTKPIDPTSDRVTILPRQYLADASGLVMFKNQAKGADLRVSAYSAPRPASVMTQPSSLTMPSGTVQKTLLPLSGTQVQQGSGKTAIRSLVSGFELQATSGALPQCTSPDQSGCWDVPEQRAADLKYVGATSDAPQLTAIGKNPASDGEVYFAVAGQGAFRHPANQAEYDIYIDTNGDKVPDAVLFNTRVPANTDTTDVMVSEIVDLNTGDATIVDGLNASLGDTDTAIFDSDVLVLPVPVADLPGFSAEHPRINYSVFSFDYETGPSIDQVGDIADDGTITHGLSLDVLHPGVSVQGSYNGASSPILFQDSPGTVLSVRRDLAAYRADRGQGVLMLHFHNLTGNKAQVVGFAKAKPTVKLSFAPTTIKKGTSTKVTVTVTGAADKPTGTVTISRLNGTKPGALRTVTLVNGTASFTYTPRAAGTFTYRAAYAGDQIYAGGTSGVATLKITA
jgi:subtilisin family serine protease